MKYEKKQGSSASFKLKSYSDLFNHPDIKDICDEIFMANNTVTKSGDKYKDGHYLKADNISVEQVDSSLSVGGSKLRIIIRHEYSTTQYELSIGPYLIKTTFEKRPAGFIITKEAPEFTLDENGENIISKLEVQRFVFKNETANDLFGKVSGSVSVEDLRDAYQKFLDLMPEVKSDLYSKFSSRFEPCNNPNMIKSNNYRYTNCTYVLTMLCRKGQMLDYSDISNLYKGIKKNDRLRAIYGLYMGEVNSANYDIYPKIAQGQLSENIEDVYHDISGLNLKVCYGELEDELVGPSKVKSTSEYKEIIDRYLILNSKIYEDEEEGRKRS